MSSRAGGSPTTSAVGAWTARATGAAGCGVSGSVSKLASGGDGSAPVVAFATGT
jgi:hypothetical protein